MRNPSSSSSHNYSNSGSNKQKGKTIPCCSKVGIKKGPWTPEEDAILINYIKRQGEGQWRALPERAGLLRCGKSCRLRWMNYLRPSIKHGPMAPDEEDLILRLHRLLGNRWSLIAGRIPGRTDNEIKNYWNTHLSKKLINKGINPRTHKHFDSENPNFSSSTHYPTCSKLAHNSSAIIVCPTINPHHNPSCPCLEEGAEERNKSPKYDQCGNIRVCNFSEGLMEKPDHHQQENQNKEDQDAFSLFIDSLINNDDNNEFVNQVDQVLQSNHNHVVVDDHDNSAAVLPNFSSTSRSMNSSDIQIDALWEADEFTYAMETSSRAEENMALDFDNHPLN